MLEETSHECERRLHNPQAPGTREQGSRIGTTARRDSTFVAACGRRVDDFATVTEDTAPEELDDLQQPAELEDTESLQNPAHKSELPTTPNPIYMVTNTPTTPVWNALN